MSSNELDMYRQIDRHIGQNSSNNGYILTLPKILCWKNVSDFLISFYIMLKKWLKVPKKMTNFFNKSTLTDFTHICISFFYIMASFYFQLLKIFKMVFIIKMFCFVSSIVFLSKASLYFHIFQLLRLFFV